MIVIVTHDSHTGDDAQRCSDGCGKWYCNLMVLAVADSESLSEWVSAEDIHHVYSRSHQCRWWSEEREVGARYRLVCFLHLLWTRTTKIAVFFLQAGRPSCQPPNQQCQSTKGSFHQWVKPQNVLASSCLHLLLDCRSTAALTLALYIFMAARCNGEAIIFLPCGFFLFFFFCLLFFLCLISAVPHWISTVLLYIVWP